MIGMKQKVLNDEGHPMYSVVQTEINNQYPYRPATKKDLDIILESLPGANEKEKLGVLQVLSGWFGWAVLDSINNTSRHYMRLLNEDDAKYFLTQSSPTYPGSIFLVQDVD